MSDRDAIPSPALGVEIPEHLRRLLYAAALKQVEEATDTAFVPDMVDAVRDAVHVVDGFESSHLSPETIIDLAKRAIDAQAPHSLAEWEALLERLDQVLELVVLIEALTA